MYVGGESPDAGCLAPSHGGPACGEELRSTGSREDRPRTGGVWINAVSIQDEDWLSLWNPFVPKHGVSWVILTEAVFAAGVHLAEDFWAGLHRRFLAEHYALRCQRR